MDSQTPDGMVDPDGHSVVWLAQFALIVGSMETDKIAEACEKIFRSRKPRQCLVMPLQPAMTGRVHKFEEPRP